MNQNRTYQRKVLITELCPQYNKYDHGEASLDEFETYYEELSDERKSVLDSLHRQVNYIYRTRLYRQSKESELYKTYLLLGEVKTKRQIHFISLEMVAERYFQPLISRDNEQRLYNQLIRILRFRGLLTRRTRRMGYHRFISTVVDLGGSQGNFLVGLEYYLQYELGGNADLRALSREYFKHQ